MCTAITLLTKDHYFGRNLDLEYSYLETVTVTPRNYPLKFRKKETLENHYALIGMAYVYDDYPLYYEATNEKGLSIAGLNFPHYADYKPEATGKDNIAPFEFIPWVLGQCSDLKEAKSLIQSINLLNLDFNKELPLTPMHWLVSDRTGSLTVEPVKERLKIYPNPVGVLTNSPRFDIQLFSLNNYVHVTNQIPDNHFSEKLNLQHYSNGLGALGLPGDWSSQSRFAKASFLKMNSVCEDSEMESVSQFFHLLNAVEHPRGCVAIEKDVYEITVYSCCCNTDKGIYYYRTYENSQITAIDMKKEDLESIQLICYPLVKEQQINWQNGHHLPY